jgi:predicted dithiol-disulfide oxidoreductase (DUF899 family)
VKPMNSDSSASLDDHPVVSHEKWIQARTSFLQKKKEFTRLRDERPFWVRRHDEYDQ